MMTAYEKLSTGVKLSDEQAYLWVMPVSSKVIRIVYSEKTDLSPVKSLIVTETLPGFNGWEIEETITHLIVVTDQLQVRVDKKSLGIAYYDSKENLLLTEPAKQGKTLESVDLIKTRFNQSESIEMAVTADGLRMKNMAAVTYVDRKSYHGKLAFDWQEGEALYGLGSHEEGIMNLRGSHQYVYQQNTKACVPVLVSSKMYSLLFDNYSLMTFHDDMYGSYLWMEYVEQLDYYFIWGDSPEDMTANYLTLTGKIPMLPKWAFGYVQSKERYIDAKELIDVATEYRRRDIPLDCLVLDWKSWEGDLWGEKVFDVSRFPDPRKMVEQLHQLQVKLMISIWPNMAPGGKNIKDMQAKGYVLGNQSTYDAFNPDARSLYWQHASEGLFSSGLDAWWCDCTEPFEGDWSGTVKPEPEIRIGVNCDEAKRYLDPAYISAYSLLHSAGIYQGQRSETKAKRVVNLTRSSYAGQHRYSTITWSGDTAATWDTLRKQVPAGLHFCVTGEPFWTMDIGAFFVKRGQQWFWDGDYQEGCQDLGYRELYLRWFQYGAFVPMFRSHGTDTPREVWQFGEKGTVFYDALVKFIHLRYQLLPYIYSLAGQVSLSGASMMRPLGMDFPGDPRTTDIRDQYMFGPALLVCPVLEAYYYEAGSLPIQRGKNKEVYLPAGHVWYDYWTNQKYQGGSTVSCEVTLDKIPLFVKAGSIIPLTTKTIYSTQEMPADELEIKVYPGADGEFTLYEDSGDGYDYEAGQYACTTFYWNDQTQMLTTKVSGSYLGFVKDKKLKVTVVSEAI